MTRLLFIIGVLGFYSSLVYSQTDYNLLLKVKEFSSIAGISEIELFPFKESLKGKKIVFLGEGEHGDGTTLALKAKIIDYLVKNLGFQVLVLELNVFELDQANQLLKKKELDHSYVLKEAFRLGSYRSVGMEQFYGSITNPKLNVQVAGLEVSYSNWYQNLLKSLLIQSNISRDEASEYLKLLVELNILANNNDGVVFDFGKFNQMNEKILGKISNSKAKENKELLLQTLKNNQNLSHWVSKRPKAFSNKDEFRHYLSLRDKGMGENLVWLITKKYAGKKIIVSTSTFHITRTYSDEPTMVDFLPDSIQKISYFLPVITYQGKRGRDAGIGSFPIRSFKRDSLSFEWWLHTNNKKYSFIDFTSLEKSELDFLNSFEVEATGMIASGANWTNIYNGVFFIDTMEPDKIKYFSDKDNEYFERVLYKYKPK